MMKYEIYTIGYTAFDEHMFINVLKDYNISCIIDVRSYPVASEYYKIYSRNNLEPLLKKNNIIYRNYAKEFGARQENKIYYTSEGYLDFFKFTQSPEFNEGVNKVKKGIELNYNFALMCAEKDPINCHRAIMVARELYNRGFIVHHILSSCKTESQEDLEKRLLDFYKIQPSFLVSVKEQILEAYKRKNQEIGYRGDQKYD